MSDLSERLRLPLDLDKPVEVPPLGLTVTLVQARDSLVKTDDGRRQHVVTGTLRFEGEGDSAELSFRSGKGFEYAEHPMAVFGTRGWLELSVFPPGSRVRP